MAVDARADGINVAVDLGVIGVFPLPALPPEPAHQNDRDDGHQENDGLGRRMLLEKAATVLLVARAPPGRDAPRRCRRCSRSAFDFIWLGRRRTHLFFTCLELVIDDLPAAR